MEYQITTRAASTLAADCLIVGIYDGKPGPAAKDVDAASDGWLKRQIRSGDAPHKLGKTSLFAAPDGIRAKRVLTVGLGKQTDCNAKKLRNAIDAAMQAARQRKLKSLAVGLTLDEVVDTSPYYRARHVAERIASALYRFDEMKSDPDKTPADIAKITLLAASKSDAGKIKLGGKHGEAIGAGASLTRDLGNLPPNVCTPTYLAKIAKEKASEIKNLSTKVINESEIKKLKMGAFLAVTSGTDEPAKLIVMEYRGAAKGAPIVLVGKGITFDAGGISLKPPPAMDEMKYDMGGAATVIGTIVVAATLGLPINVTAIVPACENMPGGKATRPGDIVKSMSGKTVEILNTDAEGRLILCDALTFAKRFKPDTVIDVATLTGACVIALGHHRTAVFSNDDQLSDALLDAGRSAEDGAWPMPMGAEYAEQLSSNFADFANVGGREGGAVTAACFLGKFTEDFNWAHLDIAGTAWVSGKNKGSTGRPVPMLSQYLLHRAGTLPR